MSQTTPKITRIVVFRDPRCRTNQLSRKTWTDAMDARLARPAPGAVFEGWTRTERTRAGWTSTPPSRHWTTAVVCGGVRTRGPLGSGVHVPVELVRRGPQRRLQVLVELQLLVLLEEVLREDRLQEHVIRLQVLDRFLQGAGDLADAVLLALARTEMVQVLVDRVAGVDLSLDAVQAGAQHRGEGEVRVAGRVRRAVLDPLRRLDPLIVHGNPDVRASVALRPGDEHGCLVAGDEPAVRVRRRVRERTQAAGVVHESADVVAAGLADLRVLVVRVVHHVLAFRPEALVDVHPARVVAEDRLRHERRYHAHLVRDHLHHVSVGDDVIGHRNELVVSHVNLALPGGRDLVVVRVQRHAERIDQDSAGLVAVILEAVDGWRGVVAFLETDRTVLTVGVLPRCFPGDNLVAGTGPRVPDRVCGRQHPDAIEDEELDLGTPVRRVEALVRRELGRTLGHVPGVAREPLVTAALVHVDEESRRLVGAFVPREHGERGRVGIHDHVGLVDLLESLNRGAVQLADALLEFLGAEGRRRNRDVLKRTEHVHELEVDPSDPFGLDPLHHRRHGHFLRLRWGTRRNRHPPSRLDGATVPSVVTAEI